MTMRRLIAALVLCLWAGGLCAGNIPATFYVDATLGSDNSSTTTGLATDNAWATVAKVNAFTRTNVALYSEDFSGAAWVTRGTGAVTPNATVAPDGNTTADKLDGLKGSIAAGDVYQLITGLTPSVRYEPSFYIKRISTSGTLQVHNGSGGGGYWYIDLALLGDGWERITRSHPVLQIVEDWASSAGGDIYPVIWQDITDSPTLSLYIWGFQLEAGGFSSPHVPTTSAAVAASFQPGDSILFKRGETWAETLTVPSSGTASSPITFGSYGVGCVPTFDNVDLNGQTYVSVLSFSGACSGCPVLLMNYDQAVACLGGSGTRYDRAKAFFTAAGCSTGTLGDMNRCYTAAQGCGTGSYVDRWQCVFGVTGGMPGIMDYIRSTYGN